MSLTVLVIRIFWSSVVMRWPFLVSVSSESSLKGNCGEIKQLDKESFCTLPFSSRAAILARNGER